jgi:hypothetical protein
MRKGVDCGTREREVVTLVCAKDGVATSTTMTSLSNAVSPHYSSAPVRACSTQATIGHDSGTRIQEW